MIFFLCFRCLSIGINNDGVLEHRFHPKNSRDMTGLIWVFVNSLSRTIDKDE